MIQYRLAFATVGDNRGAETTAAKKKSSNIQKKTLKLATASIKRID
jgi:hypothetical protein